MPAGGGHAVHASSASSAGNQVELVAIGVGERGPPGRARGDLVDDGGSEVQQSLDVGGEVGADQVGVEPVLDAVGLGDPMEARRDLSSGVVASMAAWSTVAPSLTGRSR